MLIAVMTKNFFLMKAIATRSARSGYFAARHFDTTVNLIRHMLQREAIDLVAVDPDTRLDPSRALHVEGKLGAQRLRDPHDRAIAAPGAIGRVLELG